jgi:hypothetical protein
MVMTFGTYDEAIRFYASLLEDMPLGAMTKALAEYVLEEKQTMWDERGQFVVIEHRDRWACA